MCVRLCVGMNLFIKGTGHKVEKRIRWTSLQSVVNAPSTAHSGGKVGEKDLSLLSKISSKGSTQNDVSL